MHETNRGPRAHLLFFFLFTFTLPVNPACLLDIGLCAILKKITLLNPPFSPNHDFRKETAKPIIPYRRSI
jgi:hypothetical protein